MRVLILGGRAPVALDHARRFASQGWTVYVADSIPCRISGWSRSVTRTIHLPSPRDALPLFAIALAKIIESERIDLVLPTCEEVFYLGRIRHLLPASCNVFVAPFEQLSELHSKWRFLQLANDCGVDVPVSERVMHLGAAREWAQGRPVVLKPEFSRFGVHVRIYPEGVPGDAPALPALGPWVVQEFHRGTEICSYSIAVAGRLCAHVAYRPSYRLASSSSYYFDPVSMPRIEQFVERFVARIGFTGQISFDWIDGGDGRLAVLECNPRAISGLHLFEMADALPAVIAGQSSERIAPASLRPRMLAGVMLAVGLPTAVARSSVGKWHADWSRATDVLSVSGDSRPYAGALLDMASFLRLAIKNRSTMRAAATRDIEWDGETLHE
jgi:hypothetical protein